jgi:hypothetical protein
MEFFCFFFQKENYHQKDQCRQVYRHCWKSFDGN